MSVGSVRVVTDSASMITPSIRDPYRIGVVPMTVVVEGKPHREDVDIGAAECYEALRRGAVVTTSAPSPGEVLECYEQVAREGATEIVSVHTGGQYSAVVAAARIASGLASAGVHIVDTASASFTVALAARAAARAAGVGGVASDAASAAQRAASRSGSVFVVGAAELAHRGGRFASAGRIDEASILATDSEGMRVIGRAARSDDAIEQMVAFLRLGARRGPLCVAIGDAACRPLADAMASALATEECAAEVLRYEVGPSIVAHTGLGTVGAVFAPVELLR